MRIQLPEPYQKKPAIPHFFELPAPYDVLVAATKRYFYRYTGDGWVDFEIIHEDSGNLIIQLSQYELGNLGKLEIGKLRDDLSEVFFSGPPSAASQRRKLTQEELAEIDAAPNIDEKVELRIAINKKIKNEAIDLYNRRKKNLGNVITAYLDRLGQENIWPKEIESSEIDRTEGQINLDEACKAWAGRPQIPHQNMEEFLDSWHERTGYFYSKDEFKRALKDACSRGIIDKGENNRFKLKSRS